MTIQFLVRTLWGDRERELAFTILRVSNEDLYLISQLRNSSDS